MKKKYLIIINVCLTVVILFFVRPRGNVTIDSDSRIVMGTFAHVMVTAKDVKTANACIEAGFETLRQLEAKMSRYLSDSEVSKVNREAYQHPVVVGEQTFEVIQKGVEYGRGSKGAFDITVGPLIELWKKAEDTNSVPSAAQIAEVKLRVGYEKLILDANEHSVRFAVEGMKIDLGGIAKGFAADKVIEQLQKAGVAGGLVAVAGDIRCFGVPPKHKGYWRVGVQDPSKTDENSVDDEPILVLNLTNQGVTTSGDYRRFVVVGGRRHSHIIDPNTGTSSQSLASVTIIAEKAVDADALATAVSVMGVEKGLALIESLPNTEAIIIPHGEGQKIIKTSGVDKYL